ncbi:peroxiredoxin [Sphingomonas sp.]|uniref:peroxiredoxin n=1 Tax=Sphingomonas sp. TaxID=28214 RepID=UPI00374FE037
MAINVGDRLPSVPLTLATADGPQPTTSDEFFKGKKVALFAVPGAFTPTCSVQHLPSYVEKAGALKAKGIDEVVGTSVNDAFVMSAWNQHQGSEDLKMLADGNGEFAQAIGLTMDFSKYGMGIRSQRYSMVVNDGVVEQLNVEAPGAYEASSAEHMLEQL